MISKSLFTTILSLADTYALVPILRYARLTRNGLVLSSEDYTVRYEPRDGDVLADGDACLPVAWLRRTLKLAGRKEVALSAETSGNGMEGRALVGTTRYRTEALPGYDFPTCPEMPAEARRATLCPADFTKGGAVAVVTVFAAKNDSRPALHAVHLGAEATATNGTTLSRKVLVAPLAEPVLVLLPVVRALLKLVQATDTTSLEIVRDADHVWLVAACENGAQWTLFTRIPDLTPPNYATIEGQRAACEVRSLLTVRGQDLREIWFPWRAMAYAVAIYADGSLVAWGGSGAVQHGIGTTLEAYTDEKPVVVVGSAVLDTIGKRLPDGLITVEAAGDIATIAGEVGATYDVAKGSAELVNGLPAWVHDELVAAFQMTAPTAAQAVPPVVETVAALEAVEVQEAPATVRSAAPNVAPVVVPTAEASAAPSTDSAPVSGPRVNTRWEQLQAYRAIVRLLESPLRNSRNGVVEVPPDVLANVKDLLAKTPAPTAMSSAA